jgi:putative phage-type endonuclease
MSLTEEQIQHRRSFITGSDAGTIMGVNKYDSLYDVWQFKLGLTDAKDLSDNPRVRAGNFLEPVVCDLFTQETGIELVKTAEGIEGFRVHKEHKWMGGNFDRLVPSEAAIFEAKTAGSAEGWGDQGTNIIPKPYACQVAHYMAIEDAPYCYVAVLISGWDFRWYKIERSHKFEERLIEKEFEFWDKCVLAMQPPTPRTYEDIVALYRNKTIDSPITASEMIESRIIQLRETKKKLKLLEENEKLLKDDIALFMKSNESLMSISNELLATWKQAKDSKHFDAKAFEKAHPDLYEQFLKTRPGSRRFLLQGDRNA